MNFKKALGLFLILLLVGCSGFRGKRIKQNYETIDLSETKIINGTFSIIPELYFDYHRNKHLIPDSLNTYYSEWLKKGMGFHDQEKDSICCDRFSIRTLDEKHLFVTLKNGSAIIDSTTIEGKFRKNGFFHFKDLDYKMRGIPFLFGGFSAFRKKIGFTNEGQLVFSTAYDSGGAFFLVIGDLKSYSKHAQFKQLN